MNALKQRQLQKRTKKIIILLNEMSAILHARISAVYALRDIYESVNRLAEVMIKYNEGNNK